MLHLIPAPLHRRLYRVADKLRRRWWRVRKPRRRSVNVLALDDEGRVLLVRHSYGRPLWMLPGGGIGRGETPREAAAREFREELGCNVEDLRPLVTTDEPIDGSIDRQHVFVGRLAGAPRADMRELIAAQLFPAEALPPDIGRLTAQRIAEWRKGRR